MSYKHVRAGVRRQCQWLASALVVAAVGLGTLSSTADANAQTVSPGVHFATADTSACDVNHNTLTFAFTDLVDVSFSIIQVKFRITGDGDGSETTVQFRKPQITNNSYTYSYGSAENIHFNDTTGQATYTYEITDAVTDNGIHLRLDSPRVMNWHVYGTPSNDPNKIASNYFGSVNITTPDRFCGFDVTLKANDAWNAISTYDWACSSDLFTLEPKGTSAELKEVRLVNGKGAAQAIKTTITLTQTVAGMCTNSFSKEITALGIPEGTIAYEDAAGIPQDVKICTAVEPEYDPNRDFKATLALAGEAPFHAILSTGNEYSRLPIGTTEIDVHASEGGNAVISQLIDKNGCSATEGMKHGHVSVVDRKPLPVFHNDTVLSKTRDTDIEVELYEPTHNFEWGVVPSNDGSDAWVEGNSYKAEVHSYINRAQTYYVIETDNDGVSCSSDTTYVTVDFKAPLRYPNGISPNGDGKNDRLIIEGLPLKNSIMVLDRRGKKVFEAQNYRNDWTAEGLDDGYYVYVFKGEGEKTVKTTLVIKRTME